MLKLIKRKLEKLYYNSKVSFRAKNITVDKSFYLVMIRGQFIKRNQHLLFVKFWWWPFWLLWGDNPQIINAVEKKKTSYPISGNLNWYSHYGEQYEFPQKTKNKTTTWFSNPTSVYILAENRNSKRYMHLNVHCSVIYNGQEMEAT